MLLAHIMATFGPKHLVFFLFRYFYCKIYKMMLAFWQTDQLSHFNLKFKSFILSTPQLNLTLKEM